MDILLAYIAGLLTLINPCVLPVLPLVLGAAVQSHRHAPLALAAGMGLSFVSLGLLVAVFGRSIGLTEEGLGRIGATLMIGFGVVLVVPRLANGFEMATAGFAARADRRLDDLEGSGLAGQFLGGVLLGAVWSPCVGPTLGGAIALASQGESLGQAALIMTGFALGIGSIIVALGYGARELIRRRQAGLRRLAGIARPFMGALFIAVGLMILTGLTRIIESRLLDILPYWLQDLSIAI
ncbi:MAG: cytochrome c biogenesis CcdA family protein [Rhodobacteraceae bacterium]|nr:cytochrome c biogenesis CcdA family protein [Paracoccaceae bacterium]